MVEEQVRTDFDRARHKAFRNELLSYFSRRPNALLSFHEVRKRYKPEQESYRGMQEVPVRQIIGSVDRFRDFDRAFLPRHARSAGRWQNVDRAYYQDVRLPPVQLYKVGDVYFVKDGNHRVSVARERGVQPDVSGGRVLHLVAVVLQRAANQPGDPVVVLDHQNPVHRTPFDDGRRVVTDPPPRSHI